MIRRLAAFARPFAVPLAASTALRVVHLGLGIGLLAFAVHAVAQARGGNAPDAAAVLGLILLLATAKGAARYGEQYLGHWVAFTVLARLRTVFFDAIARQPPGVLHRHRSGDLTARATQDVNRIEVFYAHTVAPAIAAAVVSLGAAGYLAVAAHPALAAILLAGAALSGLAVPALWRGRLREVAGRRQHVRGQIAAHITDTIGGLRELIQLRALDRRRRRLGELDAEAGSCTRTLAARTAARRAANLAVLALTACAVALAGAHLWRDRRIDQQAWWVAIAIAVALEPALTAVEAFASEFGTTLAAARRFFAIVDAAPAPEPEHPCPAAPPRNPAGAEVRLRGVRFAYPGPGGHAVPVLDGIDLDLPAGSTTAILGATGSGKSTLGYLLARCLSPTAGTITVDGADLRDLPEDELRRRVALVDQRPFFFSGTIAENLRLARPDAGEAELWHVIDAVELGDTVRALPDGLHTRLTERGANLSGGQLQRLALAQALLRRPALLICDEVTGQLDAATEARLLDRLRPELAGCTTVWITHRPATLHLADQVVVLEDGRVTETRSGRAGAARPTGG
ncbi:ABC transporter ATP-binding protein [Thermobispora bispora]|uniref:ABC transporter, CydDC cysteine exporter (CydDC-E) family, permease/ATP-binding protein CydC n=1 Tax=Thermobispora bispora (strain ATCC 19993 / DSM 43833 / CBS 139.67 / JCM 10125 / KCTC 9307 / NBRC 14880 / R51) TaxID=469371 RepID=D6YB67_THEBD|nr:ABC transporter ATP-binding protein [Thermobispora bispora]ADG88427.1 ABC transporter, CydDC cysteine exporter (CydDC- E) family, permease/ATP-binding protein CydC [Thermobispora bispora DSM 43833]